MSQFLWLSIWVYVSPPVSTQFRYCILQYVLLDFIFIARKRSLGQGNIFSSVCEEFCSQGGLPQYMLGYHTLPGPGDPPPEQTPLWSRHPLGPGTPSLRGADTPPGPGTPPGADPLGADPTCAVHAGRYGQQAGGMHPTGMQSCYNFHWIFLIWWYKFEEFLCNFSIFTEIKRLIFQN